MKKTKVFFMTLLIAIVLLGFSGKSLAFDLSNITSKPVELFKYIAQKLGFSDNDEEATQTVKPSKTLTVKQTNTEIPYQPESDAESFYLELYPDDIIFPVFSGEVPGVYGWRDYNDKININYRSEDWYLRIGSRTGELFSLFADELSYIPLWQTKVEYLNDLPWKSFSQLNAELFLESTFSRFSRQPIFESSGLNPEGINEISSLSSGFMDYGFRINALVENAKIGLYGWYGNNSNPLNTTSILEAQSIAPDFLWRTLNSENYQGSNNIAATVSYKLPFMRYFHQGMSPTVRLETAYRFGTNEYENTNYIKGYDEWKVGMAYEGSNHLDWLSPYGINWGVGYNYYTVVSDDLDNMDNLRRSYSSYSGNINASTYWFDMRLNTMFMYLYDRHSRGSMTVLNATYSPDWRWSYGIKANFYYGKKDRDNKDLKNISELVTTFTATYRWD